MQNEKNPFDRHPQTIPLIRFLLHTKSLANEILSKDSPAYRLIKMSSFKEVKLISLPITNEDIKKKLHEYKILLSEYYSNDTVAELKLSDGSTHGVVSAFTKRLPDNLWEPIISESEVTLADLFVSGICDYLVVSDNEPSLDAKVHGNNIINTEQALELIRIIFAYHGLYYINPNIPINEIFYYNYRFKKLFKSYQYAWTVAAYAHGKGLDEKIHDHLASLGTRLEFICRAFDKVAFFSLKSANYEDQRTQLYHLVYFIMLITGVFDSLAHIINEFYHMNMRGMSISLRYFQDKKNKPCEYFLKLQSNNPSLYEFLTRNEIQKDIKTFYPLRDSLQHRELLAGMQLHQSSEPGKNVFEITRETIEELKKIAASPNFILGFGSKLSLLDPLPFIKWAQIITTNIVNSVISLIDWNSFCETLPKDVQEKITASHEEYKKGLSQLLSWPEEPLYF